MPSATTKSTSHPFQTDDPRLHPVHEKVLAGQALTLGEVAALYASKDILAIGWMANFVRERMHGNTTQFVVNTIATAGDAVAQPEEVVVLASDLAATLRAVESVRKQYPEAKVAALAVEELSLLGNPADAARQLRNAGADALLGDGAEIFLPEVRRRIWHSAASSRKRAEARRAAREAGLQTPLYVVQRGGSPEQQAEELLTFRDVAGESFAAVSFDPDASTSASFAVTTGMQEMQQIAVARLALGNLAHVRAYWQMLGGKLVQIALRFGASQLDGTAVEPKVDPMFRSRELAREISVAGREPQEIPQKRTLLVMA
jgi:aminodeoxyfutalosine synthase